jgi:hypothetical protein
MAHGWATILRHSTLTAARGWRADGILAVPLSKGVRQKPGILAVQVHKWEPTLREAGLRLFSCYGGLARPTGKASPVLAKLDGELSRCSIYYVLESRP